MNTRIIMTASALALGASGISLTFAPELLLLALGAEVNQMSLLLGQVIGALYFGFAMLNWMAKGSLTGGIYNRPVVVANLTHFTVAGLGVIKVLLSTPGLPLILWSAGAVYALLGLFFGIMLFTHPVQSARGN